MNIKKIAALGLILAINLSNMRAMEHPNSDKTQEFVNAMQNSEFASMIQTPKFQAIIGKPEFWAMMQTPQFQTFLIALNSKSYVRIQKALEDLLETEALEDLFKTGIFSDEIRAKHNAMKETEAYVEYQGAKQLYTEGGLTQEMVDDCKTALRKTTEYNDLIDAANAEMLHNNDNSSNNTTNASSTTQSQSFAESIQQATGNNNISSNIEASLSNEEIAFLNMQQTLQYKAYDQANKLHEKHNNPETKQLLEEALGHLLETPESKILLEIKAQKKLENNSSQIYSDNVLTKNLAMEQTPEFKQYQEAKLAYEQNPNEDTKYMVDLCKAELRNTKECQEWLDATDQEQHITNNITNSEKWKRKQEYPRFQDIASLQKERNIAWLIVQNTKEYEVFKKAELAHQLHGTLQSASLLKRCQEHAKETQEYKTYFKLDQQLRAIKGEPQKHNIHSLQPQPKTNSNDCVIHIIPTSQQNPILAISNKEQARLNMINTPECKEYEKAKIRHEIHHTQETFTAMDKAANLLTATKEAQLYVQAVKQEEAKQKRNITNSCINIPKGPYIPIQLTPSNNNNNYTPKETCVPREIRLQLSNNKNNNNA